MRAHKGEAARSGYPHLSFITKMAPASTNVTPLASITGNDWIMNP